MKRHTNPSPKVLAIAALTIAALAAGCSSAPPSAALKSAGREASGANAALGGQEAAYRQDAARVDGRGLLANEELGALYQAVGEFEKSRACFEKVDSIAREMEGRAVLSGKAAGKTAAAVVTNDNALEYMGDGYERVMARTLNALNYIYLGKPEGARVEIRKADEYQTLELERHRKQVADAENDEQVEKGKKTKSGGEWDSQLAEMEKITAGVRNSFENAFTYYLSGLVYEAAGEPSEAFVDYRKALELNPSSRVAAVPAFRLAARVSRTSELEPWRARFAAGDLAGPAPDPGSGELVVLYHAGSVPRKEEVKLPIAAGDKIASLAFPVYRRAGAGGDAAEVSVAGLVVRSEPLVDVGRLAVQALKEKWPAMSARQAARVATKLLAQVAADAAADRMAKSGGTFGLFASLATRVGSRVYSVASEKADLRGWYSLPAEVQVARLTLPAGEHRLTVKSAGNQATHEMTVRILAGGTTIVNARSIHQLLHAQAATLAPVPKAAEPAVRAALQGETR